MHDAPPSDWIRRFAPLIPAGGAVLDLACGSGRHSRLLAEAGYRVEAVDRDASALEALQRVAGIKTRVADPEGGRPSNPDFLLKPGELLDRARPRLTVVAFEQGRVDTPKAAFVQRICAVAGGVGWLPAPAASPSELAGSPVR